MSRAEPSRVNLSFYEQVKLILNYFQSQALNFKNKLNIFLILLVMFMQCYSVMRGDL